MPHTDAHDQSTGPPRETPWDAARITLGIRRGDRAAFSCFYDTYSTLIFHTARTFTRRDEATCLDILQDTMIRVIDSIPTLDSHDHIRAWVTHATRCAAVDHFRKEHRRMNREQARGHPSDSIAQSTVHNVAHASADLSTWLHAQLAHLDADTTLWLKRHIGDDVSLATLADGSPRTRDAIYGVVRRTLTSLRNAAKEAFHE